MTLTSTPTEGGRTLVSSGRGVPSQGAVLADGSDGSTPCFFAAGTRRWLRLCTGVGVDVQVILTPPCVFCIHNQ
jgi:hypothetical protein